MWSYTRESGELGVGVPLRVFVAGAWRRSVVYQFADASTPACLVHWPTGARLCYVTPSDGGSLFEQATRAIRAHRVTLDAWRYVSTRSRINEIPTRLA